MFTNAADGFIDVQAGSGGGRDVYGNWVNEGTVDVEAGAGLVLQGVGGVGPDFTQAGGTLNAGAGYVVEVGGVLHYTGESLGGEFVTAGTELDVEDATGTGLIEIRGQDNQLDQNLAPGVTLWVQGSDWNGSASLTAAPGAVNAGTILLEPIHHDYWTSDLFVGPSFTNAATGVIDVQAGAGGGATSTAAGSTRGRSTWRRGPAVPATRRRRRAGFHAGRGHAQRRAGAVAQIGGVFHYTGGAMGGEFVVAGAELDVEDATGTGLIEVRNTQNVLDQNLAPGVTLWVQGCNWNGDGVLTAVDGAVNDGVIDLESIGFWWWNSRLDVVPGGTFTNDGALDVQPGSGGRRYISGNLVNQGALTADADMLLSGSIANSGTIDVAAGVNVSLAGLDGDSPALSQTAGSLTVDGSLVLPGGTLDVEGGD